MPQIPFKIIRIHHLGLAPQDTEKTTSLFQLLGLVRTGHENIEKQKTETTFFRSEASRPQLEVLKPTDPASPVAQFLSKKKSGIHHFALEVDDIETAISYLKENGVELVSSTTIKGAHNTQVIFIHPRSAGGLLIELVEEPN